MDFPKRKINRLQGYDYASPNAYFVTVCTHRREGILWEGVGAIIDRPQCVPLSRTGEIVRKYIEQIPMVSPAISLDHYVIMPNHIHLLLQIGTDDDGRSMIAPTISNVVRHMKGCVSKQVGHSVWQKGFYDHIIRNDADYEGVWNYIEGNPSKWHEDDLYV